MRLALGSAWTLAATAAARVDSSTRNGIAVFAIGIIVGTAGVCAAYLISRRRMSRAYRSWVAAGRPERRVSERRGERRHWGRRDDT